MGRAGIDVGTLVLRVAFDTRRFSLLPNVTDPSHTRKLLIGPAELWEIGQDLSGPGDCQDRGARNTIVYMKRI